MARRMQDPTLDIYADPHVASGPPRAAKLVELHHTPTTWSWCMHACTHVHCSRHKSDISDDVYNDNAAERTHGRNDKSRRTVTVSL